MRSLGVSSLYTWQSVHIVCRGVAVGAHRLQGRGSGCTLSTGVCTTTLNQVGVMRW